MVLDVRTLPTVEALWRGLARIVGVARIRARIDEPLRTLSALMLATRPRPAITPKPTDGSATPMSESDPLALVGYVSAADAPPESESAPEPVALNLSASVA